MLTVEQLSARYGAMPALQAVSFTLPAGRCLAVMGRNGMGKTTLVRALLGQVSHSARTLDFAGHAMTSLSTSARAQLGIGLVPEGRRLFDPLSVADNLTVVRRAGAWSPARLFELLPILAARRHQQAGTLSGGEKQMLAIARALSTQPKLLILDEATEGLAPQIRQDIWRLIGTIKAEGLSILLIDSRLQELLPVADDLLLLERGQTVWSGPRAAFEADTSLVRRYLTL